MKTIACVAEYNPFHLGHLKHLDYVKNTLNADNIIVIMSGNFTQRGEIAIMNKYTRAKHAILAGADMVIELPTVFATANAEIFSFGAVKILNSLNSVDGLCFGVESGEKLQFINVATTLNNETKEYKQLLKSSLDEGLSLAKAKCKALKATIPTFDEQFLSTPNNILGVEYTKALLKLKSDIEIFPMLRTGDHNDKKLKKGITSATSIRETIKGKPIKKIKGNIPSFTYKDISGYPNDFDKLLMAKIIMTSPQNISKILDCTEGLENRIKALAKDNRTIEQLVEKVSTKRYTKTRVSRIILSNFLDITKDLVFSALSSPLYAKVLAIKESKKELLSAVNKNSTIPVITRQSDLMDLKKTAKDCYEKDLLASDLYALICNQKPKDNQMLII